MDQQEIKKAFVNLQALKNNLPPSSSINEKYIHIFHDEIDRLIKIGFTNIDDFKIPENEIQHKLISFKPAISEFDQKKSSSYSEDRYVERGILLIKIDALLAYFQVFSPEVKIGFKAD